MDNTNITAYHGTDQKYLHSIKITDLKLSKMMSIGWVMEFTFLLNMNLQNGGQRMNIKILAII